MRSDAKFRCFSSWPAVVRTLLPIILAADGLAAHKSILADDKRVFDSSFAGHKKFAIDDCLPLAFGDFNADKIVDIFCRNTKGDSIRVMLNDDRSPTSREQCRVTITGTIYDALAADYDGDSKLDLFVIYKKQPDQIGYNGGFMWGDRITLSSLEPINYLFQTIPTTVDINGDSYVELLGMISEDQVNYRPACLLLNNRTVLSFAPLTNVDNLVDGATQAIVDLTHDLVADLFLTVVHDKQPKFRIYQLPMSNMALITEYDPPTNVALYHLSTFADIDADGELEHLLPVCMNADCSDSRIYVRDNNEWYQLPINFGPGVQFPLRDAFPTALKHMPTSIKVADYNLDGYPDIVAVMKHSSLGTTMTMLLQNQRCDGSSNMTCSYNRTFVPQIEETSLSEVTNASLAAFFDILENGYPDVLILQGSQEGNFTLTGFQNTLVQDVHFIKVMVLSSFSCDTCSRRERLPYGNNQPGQSIKMETITTMNGIQDFWIKSAAIQMAQSGQLTLELPYAIIGLGSTPNFVEKLTIAIPPNIQSNQLIRTYTQMIPNSQIVVVPSPLMSPEKWHSKLFLTPSRMIIHAGIALGVTLVVLTIVLAVLQYREQMEDNRERKEQSQTFHYDAL